MGETPSTPHTSGPYREPLSGSHRYGKGDPDGRRWTDSAKVVWALIGGITFLIMSWGGVVFTTAQSAQTKNVEQDVHIQTMETRMERMEEKLDRIYERVK